MATPLRTYRATDEVYLAAQEAAAQEGEPLTDVITRALVAYARKSARKAKAQEMAAHDCAEFDGECWVDNPDCPRYRGGAA